VPRYDSRQAVTPASFQRLGLILFFQKLKAHHYDDGNERYSSPPSRFSTDTIPSFTAVTHRLRKSTMQDVFENKMDSELRKIMVFGVPIFLVYLYNDCSSANSARLIYVEKITQCRNK